MYIYLVPELMCLTGLTDDQKNNFKIMKSLGEYTKLDANTRMESTRKMLTLFEGNENLLFDIKTNPQPLQGYRLQTPQVMLGKGKEANVRPGEIKIKEKVLDPFNFQEMVFVYSVSTNKEYA